jgi:hypothetical protein
MKSLTKITAKNKSKITVEGTLTANKLDISLTDATLSGNIAAQKANITLSKGAQANLSGTCHELKTSLASGSSIGSTSLAVDVLEAKLNGQCTARLTVNKSIVFNGTKGSSLHYMGSPQLKLVKASEDSSISKID